MADRGLSGAEEGARGWAGERRARRPLGWLGDTLTPACPWAPLAVTASAPRRAASSLLGGGLWTVSPSLPLTRDAAPLPPTGSRPPAVRVMKSRGLERARARRWASQSGGGMPPTPRRVCSASLRPWVCIRPPGSWRHMNINSLLFFISGSKSLCKLNCRHANNPISLGRVSPLGSIYKTNVCHPRVSTSRG